MIKPPYQRKPVWAARQKCYLIESILNGLPIPEIYIQQIDTPEGETTYAIVDGQQRIRTVLQFIGSETESSEQEYNKFALDKLDTDSHWRNVTFAELPNDIKKKFYGYRFAVRYLFTDKESDVRDMFQRLNKFLTPLKPQELRNATYTGPFVKLATSLADGEFWAENRIVTPASIRRMNDVEFVSELLVGVLHGPQSGRASDIDAYYEQYEDYEDEFPDQKRAKRLFDETLETIQRVLPDIKETRWNNKTDFYTLFVALAFMLKSHELPDSNVSKIRETLKRFADEINSRLSNEEARVNKSAVDYVRAVEKGANDKKRRGDRHIALTGVIEPYFKPRKSTR
ncbi:MAG: DUF262 domain-containing protein [Acidobacteria bacterium]|nr:DUF262 domain-containing protein [Acidobacteriota bacterium]